MNWKIEAQLAELIGIIMGDGYLYNNFNKYIIGIVGDPVKEKEYFLHIQKLIKNVFNKDVNAKVRGRGLRIVFGSKEIFNFLTKEIGLPYGQDKCERIKIPEKINSDWTLARHTIRGLYDTDGSVFVSNKKRAPNYPTIELTSTSKSLLEQVKNTLNNQGFRTSNIRSYKYKNPNARISHKLSLNGRKNLIEWLEKISFSNPRKLKIAQEIKMGRAGFEPATPTASA
ncbi:hypothetical protein HY837_05910 [archaeon]|nr:hypothetical protein [archaeon]